MTGAVSATARPVVLAAIRDVEWRSHVRSQLDPSSRLVFVDHPLDLVEAARPRPDVVLWHLDLGRSIEDCEAVFQRLRRIAPRVRVVAYGQVGRAMASLFLIAGRIGVDRLLLRGFDDLARGVHELLASSEADMDVTDALSRLNLPPGPASMTVAHCLRRAANGPLTVQQLAADLRVSRRTVASWLDRAHLPTPERLIGWCRIYGVGRLLDDPRCSISQIARQLAFHPGLIYVGWYRDTWSVRRRSFGSAVAHLRSSRRSRRASVPISPL